LLILLMRPPTSPLFPYTTLFRSRLGSGMQSSPIFKIRLGMIDTRFALPQRSPKPLSVPCTWPTPSATAASEFATAHSASLCTWRSEEHTSELQSRFDLVCRLLLE